MSAIIARRPRSSYTPAPDGLHTACCVDIVDLGIVAGAYGAKHKVRIVWQLDAVDDEHGRRFDVARVYTLSLHERAALRKDLESWRGKKFTEAELDGFDLQKLLGVNCQVQVVQQVSEDGSVYANVATVVPPAKGRPKLAPLDYVRAADRVPRNGSAPQAPAEQEVDNVPF